MKNIIISLLAITTLNGYSQSNLAIDSFPNINLDDGIKWQNFLNKKDNKYYSVLDSSKLTHGMLKYRLYEDYVTQEFYDSGTLFRVENIYLNNNFHSVIDYENNNIKDGVYTFYYDTGEREEEKTYLNGKLNGTSILFYRSGKIATIENYVDGILNGKVISFFENGLISSEVFVKNGEKKGLSVKYYENGQKALEQHYISTFKLGSGCEKNWYSNGVLGWEICYDESGNKDGMEKAYDEWGVLKYKKEWETGKVKSRIKFGSLDNLRFPNIVDGHREKMQYYFDNDDW